MAPLRPRGLLSSGSVLALCALLLLLGLVAPATLFIAVYPLGNSYPDDASACQAEAETAQPLGALVDQDTPVTATRMWFPPAVTCVVDAQRNGHPVLTVHRNWLASSLAVLEVLAVVAVLVRLAVALITRCLLSVVAKPAK